MSHDVYKFAFSLAYAFFAFVAVVGVPNPGSFEFDTGPSDSSRRIYAPGEPTFPAPRSGGETTKPTGFSLIAIESFCGLNKPGPVGAGQCFSRPALPLAPFSFSDKKSAACALPRLAEGQIPECLLVCRTPIVAAPLDFGQMPLKMVVETPANSG